MKRAPNRDNPFGILILALPFVLGGIILLLQTKPGVVVASPAYRAPGYAVETASVPMEHAAGVVGLSIGCVLAWFYIRARK